MPHACHLKLMRCSACAPCVLWQSLPGLTAAHIVHVSRVQLEAMVMYSSELGNALAVANKEGEDARREERMRIWGYA